MDVPRAESILVDLHRSTLMYYSLLRGRVECWVQTLPGQVLLQVLMHSVCLEPALEGWIWVGRQLFAMGDHWECSRTHRGEEGAGASGWAEWREQAGAAAARAVLG